MIISTITNNLYLKVDGTTVRSAVGITTSSNVHLFEGTGSENHRGPSRLYHTYQKLYKCIIKDANDNYVRYFIPALDNDNRPCMYDTVTLTAFYNEGEGEFLYKTRTEFKKRPYPSIKLFPLGGKGHVELPNGYVRCEYLQSTGTLGFDTGVSIKDKIIYIDSLWTALSINPNKGYSIYNALFGENAKSNECVIGWHSLDTHYFGGIWKYSLSLNTRYYIKIITLTGNLGITINENILRQGINSYVVDLNLRLFTGTGSYDFDAPYYTYQKLYKCTIADANGILIRNFIPALDETGIPCMYDTVSKQPFYNEGTGEFLYKIK